MGGRRWKQAVGFAILLLALMIPASAGAGVTDIPIEGTVTDRIGRPIQAVQISEGGRRTWTDANGHFTIQLPLGQTYTLAASHLDYETAYGSGRAMAGARTDFSLFTKIHLYPEPSLFERVPQILSLTASTRIPPNDLCVNAFESATSTNVQLTAGVTDDDGNTKWTASVTIPSGTDPGRYYIQYLASTCSSGEEMSHRETTGYVYDPAPPEVAILTPQPGHYYLGGEDRGLSSDGRTTVVGPLRFEFEVSDDVYANVYLLLPGIQMAPFFDGCSMWQGAGPGKTRFTCKERAFTNSQESLSITVTDLLNRTATSSLTFHTRP